MEFGQCYCLRWNNYQSSVVSVMRSLLQDKVFLDVTIACDGRSVHAHRLMLASCSDFFNDILRENQSDHPIIFLRDVNFWELEAIMDFIYNGQVNIMQDQLPGFIKTAETLQIKGLAAVNNNNNSNFDNNNIKNEFVKYNSDTPIQDITKLNAYGPQHPHNVKYEVNNSISPPPTPLPFTKPSSPLSFYKKRRYGSPSSPDITSSSLDSSIDSSPLKSSAPLSLNPLAPTISSVASMASSISVAKAISLSKLVHEISSQASIASLKSASLPPSHPTLPPEDLTARDDTAPDSQEPLTPPSQQAPHHMPTAQFHNTKDWASNKNEDGFPACSLCGKVFKHQGSLVAHYQVHQQRTKCPVCQKVLSRHYHMKVHLLTVHKVPDSEIDSLLRTQHTRVNEASSTVKYRPCEANPPPSLV